MSKKRERAGMGMEIDGDMDDDVVDEPAAVIDEPEPQAKPRQGNRPICPRHNVQMKSYSTAGMFTYYRCPTPGCGVRDKQVRPIGPLKDMYGHGKSKRS